MSALQVFIQYKILLENVCSSKGYVTYFFAQLVICISFQVIAKLPHESVANYPLGFLSLLVIPLKLCSSLIVKSKDTILPKKVVKKKFKKCYLHEDYFWRMDAVGSRVSNLPIVNHPGDITKPINDTMVLMLIIHVNRQIWYVHRGMFLLYWI